MRMADDLSCLQWTWRHRQLGFEFRQGRRHNTLIETSASRAPSHSDGDQHQGQRSVQAGTGQSTRDQPEPHPSGQRIRWRYARKRLSYLVGSTPLIDSSNRGVQACSGSRFESLNSKLAQARTLQRQASLHPSLQKQRECTLIPAVALRVLSIRYACVLQEAP